MGGGGEPGGHVEPDLGEDDLGGVPREISGISASRLMVAEALGSAGAASGGRAGGAVRVDALRGRDRGDQLLGPGGEHLDLSGEGVDLVQQDPGELAVVIVELVKFFV